MKCQLCGEKQSECWLWQPFGPHESPRDAFAYPGYHYRGFPALKVCDTCKGEIANGEPVYFTYKGTRYSLLGEEVHDYIAEHNAALEKFKHNSW